MSKKLFLLVMVLSLALIAAAPMAPSYAPPGPTGTFGSAFTIQNLSAVVANCSYQFFDASGAAAFTSASFTIAANGSSFTYVPSIAFTSGQYSGVVSCDQQVSAVINTGSANSGGSYGAISTPATTWYAPNAFSNYYNYNTNFVVQNASATPADITVQIIDAAGTVVATQTATGVAASAYANFEQAGLAGLVANTAYSAKITGTGAIAVESNIYGQGTAENELYSYAPFTAGSLVSYAPVIMNNYYGYNTALTVQNLSTTTAAAVTVTYGTGLTQSHSIPASSSYVFYTPASGLPTGTLTSARIDSDQPVVALVNENNVYKRAASYTAFASGGTKISIPVVMKRYFNYNTSVTCQNIGAGATNITITYSNAATSTQSAVASGGTALFYQPAEAGLSDGFNGSATITSSAEPIVCVANEDQNEGAQLTTIFDQLFSYEGTVAP